MNAEYEVPPIRPVDQPIRLRDYQQETVDKLASPPRGVSRSLAVLPTGTGKTIVFAALLDRLLLPGERGLVIAHREELLQQARDKLALAAPSLHCEIEQAESHASRTHPPSSLLEDRSRSVVVGSVQTLRGKRLQEWAPDAFRLVVVDEAHHATAESYIDLLSHFGCFDDVSPTRLVGVTATPGRTDGVGLGEVFQEIAVCYGIADMIRAGHLAEIRAWQVQTNIDLRNVKTVAGDYHQGQLEEAVNNDKRNLEIVSAYERYANGAQAIVFAAGVDHSNEIARLFNQRGIPAKSVYGAMERDERAQAITGFHAGQTRILSNYGVLTEGFDAPATSCIILGRPTKSELLYTQMLGRGTRLHPGKEHLLAIDVCDVSSGKNLASVASLFGLPPRFKTAGGSVTEMAEELEEVDPGLRHLAVDAESIARLVERTKAAQVAVAYDPFAVARYDEAVREFTTLSWVTVGDEKYSIRPEQGFTYAVECNTLGQYQVEWIEEGKTHVVGDKAAAFRAADKLIARKHPERVVLFDTEARWREAPASEKQIALLTKIRRGRSLPSNLTRGEASAMLDEIFRRHRRAS